MYNAEEKTKRGSLMKQFSQTQIQDYLFCPRRYFLSHIQKITWPEPVSPSFEKIEESNRQGKAFHLFINRLIQGVSYKELISQVYETDLNQWLKNFKKYNPLPDNAKIFSEIEISAIFAEILWIGYMDAVAFLPDKIQIFDWKTSRRVGDPKVLLNSPQTRLYCFLMMQNHQNFLNFSGNISPDQIEMVYWYARFPSDPIHLQYSAELYDKDLVYFKDMAEKLCYDDRANYPQTLQQNNCRFCRFQTFCFKETLLEDESLEDEFLDSELFGFFQQPDQDIAGGSESAQKNFESF